MSIMITVDSRSELEWVKNMIEIGSMNASGHTAQIFHELGIPLRHTVTYKPSENYVEDISEQIKQYNKKISEKRILKEK